MGLHDEQVIHGCRISSTTEGTFGIVLMDHFGNQGRSIDAKGNRIRFALPKESVYGRQDKVIS